VIEDVHRELLRAWLGVGIDLGDDLERKPEWPRYWCRGIRLFSHLDDRLRVAAVGFRPFGMRAMRAFAE